MNYFKACSGLFLIELMVAIAMVAVVMTSLRSWQGRIITIYANALKKIETALHLGSFLDGERTAFLDNNVEHDTIEKRPCFIKYAPRRADKAGIVGVPQKSFEKKCTFVYLQKQRGMDSDFGILVPCKE